MQVKHAYPAETDPITQMGAPHWQRAPIRASETQLRKRVSNSVGFSSGLAFTCSLTYSETPIGTKPMSLLTSSVRRYLNGRLCSSSQSRAISAALAYGT